MKSRKSVELCEDDGSDFYLNIREQEFYKDSIELCDVDENVLVVIKKSNIPALIAALKVFIEGGDE